ncbi:hypothetical protein V1523DRAFT_427680 [Lipomyces doorenjongii]
MMLTCLLKVTIVFDKVDDPAVSDIATVIQHPEVVAFHDQKIAFLASSSALICRSAPYVFTNPTSAAMLNLVFPLKIAQIASSTNSSVGGYGTSLG